VILFVLALQELYDINFRKVRVCCFFHLPHFFATSLFFRLIIFILSPLISPLPSKQVRETSVKNYKIIDDVCDSMYSKLLNDASRPFVD